MGNSQMTLGHRKCGAWERGQARKYSPGDYVPDLACKERSQASTSVDLVETESQSRGPGRREPQDSGMVEDFATPPSPLVPAACTGC